MARADFGRTIIELPWRKKLQLAVALLRDERVPLIAKIIMPAVVLYLASPLDLVPDFIPGVGQVDDLLLVAGALTVMLWFTPRAVIEEHLTALKK
jgi:carbonic anhydrase